MITIHKGLLQSQRTEAAALYWEAFGGKLGTVLGPSNKALGFLEAVIRADHCYVAQSPEGQLLGLAGFKSPSGSFAGGSIHDMSRVYGWWGAQWRSLALWSLSRETDNNRFLIDGISVTRHARGIGIGTALLAALYAEAEQRGYDAIRLDVIDSNWRAKALYERENFIPIRTQGIGPLRHLFGFASVTTMVRPITPFNV